MKLPLPCSSCGAHPLMYLQATVLVCCRERRVYLITSIMCSQCCVLVQLTGESHLPSLTHSPKPSSLCDSAEALPELPEERLRAEQDLFSYSGMT